MFSCKKLVLLFGSDAAVLGIMAGRNSSSAMIPLWFLTFMHPEVCSGRKDSAGMRNLNMLFFLIAKIQMYGFIKSISRESYLFLSL